MSPFDAWKGARTVACLALRIARWAAFGVVAALAWGAVMGTGAVAVLGTRTLYETGGCRPLYEGVAARVRAGQWMVPPEEIAAVAVCDLLY